MRKKLVRVGDLRVREGFLWLPRTITHERRWLENARWEETYMNDYGGFFHSAHWVAFRWLPPYGGMDT